MLAFQTHKTLEVAAAPTLERIRLDRQRVDRRLAPLLEHIEGHLFDPGLDVNQMKRSCGVRDNSVPIQFHAQLGLPPHAYIEECRLKTGCRLLRDSELKIWQIADLLGYSSIQVFSRAFTRWAGNRPTVYRKKSRRERTTVPSELPATLAPQDAMAPEALRSALDGKLDATAADRLIRRLLQLYPANALLLERNGGNGITLTTPSPRRRPTRTVVPKAEPAMANLLGRDDVEHMRAEVFWSSVRTRSFDEQAAFVAQVKGFSTPALFRYLGKQARVEGREDRSRGVRLAELALLSLGSLVGGMTETEVSGLRAEGFCWLATAKALTLDFAGAELALAEAERFLSAGADLPLATAEVLWHRSSLRIMQRDLATGLALNRKAMSLFVSAGGSDEQIGRAWLNEAQVLARLDRVEEATAAYRKLLDRLPPESEPYLFFAGAQSLCNLLIEARAYDDAATFLPAAYRSLDLLESPGLRLYLEMIEGQIARGKGDTGRAEVLFLSTRNAWLENNELWHASRASLELALLYVQTGKPIQAQQEAAQLVPWFETLNLGKEALAARQVLHEATEAGALTATMIEQLRRTIGSPTSTFARQNPA